MSRVITNPIHNNATNRFSRLSVARLGANDFDLSGDSLFLPFSHFLRRIRLDWFKPSNQRNLRESSFTEHFITVRRICLDQTNLRETFCLHNIT